jgi:predicted nucleic acid-binding protein
MPKPKIYLDTSAISHLEQPEKPHEQAHSRDMFAQIKEGSFTVFLSEIVFREVF